MQLENPRQHFLSSKSVWWSESRRLQEDAEGHLPVVVVPKILIEAHRIKERILRGPDSVVALGLHNGAVVDTDVISAVGMVRSLN